ncbi:hypothetical protein TOPH_08807 [Tolypocladium ophioglossoides CBS 100239]|uniref:Uncharacterized protein n=1 Tax=Tolypocladium ophioglossoides (strain CBS 100239) TaxID=1163406 RepID=A0A0L0MYL0_TOLOC|nr:hypothetical protein TOPH_08807 [Tolypocladium ophioglossoides CBS 100239]
MVATHAPGWCTELPPMKIQPLPASFAPFFPTADEHAMTAEKSSDTIPQDLSWIDFLGAQRAYCRLPAWTRVRTEAHASTRAVRTIMKKIGLPTRYVARTRSLERTASQTAIRTPEQEMKMGQDHKCELPPSKHQRLVSFEPSQEGHETVGRPQSEAEMASVIMRAKVDLANRILAASTDTLAEELELLRKGFKNQVTPAKRRIDREFRLEEDGILGGFRLRSYDLIWPVLTRAAFLGDEQIDVRMASIAEISANLRDMRRDPRCHVALRGLPELSDVADVTEPESTMALMKPPEAPAEATSPMKRQAQPTRPVELRASRLSDTIVKLLPASSPKAEPSPTKSASAPSTPFAEIPAAQKIVTTSPFLRSTASTSYVHVAPAQQISLTRASNGPKVFRAPSHDDSSSSSLQSIEASSPLQPSPSKLSRPVAPTPSRWNRAESSTPPSKTPCRRGSGLGLVDAIPPSTPQLPALALKGIDANDSAPFDFGPVSPSFNSPSWLGGSVAMPDSHRGSGLKKSSRRKSEPLIRSCYRNQATPPQCLSPQKLSFSNELFLNNNDDATAAATVGPSLRSPHKHLVSGTMYADQRRGLDTPEMSQSPDVTMGGTVTPAISWAKMTGRVPPTVAVQSTPMTNAAADPKNVFNVDMRQNLDIFGGSQAASPMRRASAIDQLAQIAEECCGSQANVVVTQEHGRLFVRFKLPVEYASKFPESQGFDESHFTSTPSAISSSPRNMFRGHYLSANAAVASPSPSPTEPKPGVAAALDETMVSDLAPSPPAQSLSVDETAHPGVDDTCQISAGSADDPTIEEHSTTLCIKKSGRDSLDNESSLSQGTPPKANGQSDSWLKLLRTPTINDLATTELASNETAKNPAQQRMSTPTAHAMDVTPTNAPNLTTSFIPVNQSTPHNGISQPGSARGASQHTQQHAPGSARGLIQQHDYDSPGRAYMREFIKRSKPKGLSATETGSPIGPPAKRQPLGAKSPNAESPQKGKRKAGSERLGARSPLKKRDAPVPKRSRRHGKMIPRVEAGPEMDDPETAQQPGMMTEQGAAQVAEDADGDQDDEEMADVPATRRSSRLRSQGKAVAAPKSSIPTPIKFGGRSGAGCGTALRLTSRTEQQDLTYQTRMNTRKNRANAEYPAQFLARQSSDDMEVDGAAGEADEAGESSNRRKCVGWKDPIESHQDEKPKRGRPPKAKATHGNANVAAKSTTASATAQSRRTAKVAANLGMSVNGTPAKAGRVTRSSTRIQK